MRQQFASWYRRGSVLIALCALLALCASATAGSAAAAAGSPQWAVTAVPTPNKIEPESPRTEVDLLTVDATGGTYTLKTKFGSEVVVTAPLAYNASASEVEEVINNGIGTATGSTVTVTAGPGGASPYTITWGGNASHKILAFPQAEGVRTNSSELTGVTHTATLSTLTRGVDAPQLIITATNVGDLPTDGSAITLNDVLPPGLNATAVTGRALYRPGSTMECSTSPTLSCKYEAPVDAGDILYITVTLAAGSEVPIDFENKVTVTGGGTESTDVTTSLPTGLQQEAFGPVPHSVVVATSTMQAGAHPDLTTAFALNTAATNRIAATAKDVSFDLPVGLVGNAVGMPRCSMQGVIEQTQGKNVCPADSMVGMATISLNSGGNVFPLVTPVFNIAPAPGEPVAFGFDALAVPARLDTSVLSNGDYGARVTTNDINETAPLTAANITIWGVPADHNGPGEDSAFTGSSFGGLSGNARVPLLTNPQQCSVPLTGSMETDPWEDPGHHVKSETQTLGTPTGCDQLRIGASFSMVPDTLEAGAPAGYRFDLKVPQNNAPSGLGTPNVKTVTLKLPAGTVVNPSAAWGLKACSDAQFYGPDHPSEEPASLEQCPREAQVGTVQIKTPALEELFEGQVFLAEPECDPCTPADAESGKMVRLFVQAISEGEGGIVVKLEGRAHIDQSTGQITTVFDDNPQLPFDEFKLNLSGGPRAVLANPRVCGLQTSNLDLTPWSTPITPDVTPSYSFEVSQNCFGPQFNPSFVAGIPNIQAGAYTSFTMSFGRSDSDQYLNGLSLRMPPGLLGNIGSVALCKEPQAAQGTCGSGSLIGHVQVLTGPGTDPFLVPGGQVFLTEGYKGAPYGLSIVVPAIAGPYTLSGSTGQGTVVVRAKIQVDPTDAHLTVTADPLPTTLDGIPLQLKVVNVTIDKPNFTFNPTSCAKTAVGASLSSTEGATANVSRAFQVTNCANLKFGPKLAASTAGKTSRQNGASLTVKLTYPPSQSNANIAKVKVDLPKQLPSRLTTLQKACTAAQFEANPAGCPASSIVGHGKAITPILPVPLEGPAYFVSHGGEAFPSLVVVLQGYGTTVDLVGTTFISHAGITSSTFKAVPDVPVGTFELTLPEGKYSALAASGNLCKSKLAMPTAFVAQNGAEIHQSTPIVVTGCPKAKKAKAKKAKGKKNAHGKKAKGGAGKK